MTPMSLSDLAAAVGGTLHAADDVDVATPRVSVVSTDSRTVASGAAFVAIRGETADGHRFLPQVAARGAAVAIVDAPPDELVMPMIVVSDTRRALGALAARVRAEFDRCKVVGVAGSNGKTSTKHLIAAALGASLRGTASPKSFNNDIGVPLTIFPVDPIADDFVVLELGTNHHGEIRTLARIARPDVCVITNCTAEHLEGLGDLDGVRAENASVTEGMTARGTLIVLGDDRHLLRAVEGFDGTTIQFGFESSNDLVASDVRVGASGTSFSVDGRRIGMPMIGRHNALNALAAIAVARVLGVDEDRASDALADSTKPEMRMDRREAGGVTVLDDAYNANPASMRAAVETLLELAPAFADGRRIAVLGEMREMGDHSERLHRELGLFLASVGDRVRHVVCVGSMSRWIAEEYSARRPDGQLLQFATSMDAAEPVASLARPGDIVLVKGSRGMRMERVVERLLAVHAAVVQA